MRLHKIALAAVILIDLCVPASAESRRIMGGSAGGSKYQFFYDTFLDPSLPELGSMGGGTIGGEGIIHRFMSDRRQRVYFGYDISIDVLPEPNTYRITFSQLTPDSVRQVLADDAALRALYAEYGHVGGALDLFNALSKLPDAKPGSSRTAAIGIETFIGSGASSSRRERARGTCLPRSPCSSTSSRIRSARGSTGL